MANYRPKSLTELNNLYDKSIAAENTIKTSGSAIADSDTTDRKDYPSLTDDFSAPREKTAAQVASDDLADALNDFMKNFGNPSQDSKEKAPVRQPLPITKVVKPTTPPKQKNSKKTQQPIQKVNRSGDAEKAKDKKEKPDFMRNSERSDLLDDYMKIMNDEDEDSAFVKSLVKKKKRLKKDRHQTSPVFDDNEESTQEEVLLQEGSEEYSDSSAEQPEPDDSRFDDAEQFESFFKNDEEETSDIQPEENEYPEEIEESFDEEADEFQPAKKQKKKKSIFVQVFLMIVLLFVLVSAVAVGLLKVVVGVDTGEVFADSYYVFTANQTYEKANINQGDLVITQIKEVKENDVFAYRHSTNGIVSFALKGSNLTSDRFMAHSDSGIEFIKKEAVRGAVIKTVPQIGSVVRVLTENFIIVISVLVAIALILILVIALAFKGKPDYGIDAIEEEAEPEYDSDDDYTDNGYDDYNENSEAEDPEDYYDGYEAEENRELFSTTE